ncbi:MAG: Ig-like domain-containing protein, partial [Planctomycetota bacterium]
TAEDVETLRGPSGPILLSSITKLADDRFQLSFPEQTEKGSYQLRIGSAIKDLYGNQMESAFDLFIELELWQYASSVIDFSSQYSPTSWSAAQALGAPDTLIYGDARTAWAPSSINGTTETLTLGFDTPVQSSGAIIRQTFGNGFVRQIEVRDAATGNFEVVSTATDTSQPGSPVDYVITWPQTSYPVDAIRITVDTNHSGSFEEIDAVTLRGVVPPDTVGPRVVSTVPNRGMSGPIDHIEVAFSESIDASSFTLDDLSTLTTPNGVVPIQSITPVSESRFRLGFTEQREWGDYSVSIGPGIQDLAGNSMDQNSDGVTDQTDVFELAFALELWQYASSVIDFSSQYSATSWSAEQALGTPDTLTYGDARTAWAPSVASGGTEYLTLGFDDAVLSTGAVVRQTFGNGFVHTIEARDADTGTFVLLFDGVDDSQPGAPVDFVVDWSMTQFPVDALRISVDTSHSFSFEEIDAVQLRGVIAPDFTGPHVLSTNPSASASSPLSAIEVTFDETIDASSVDVGDVVSFVGPNGAVEVNSVSVVNGQRMRIEFDPLEDFGAYSFQVGPGIFDLSGNPMDQDRDGVNGESLDDVYSGQFNLQLEQFAASVIDFTSQYSPFGWSASDALGAPNTFEYGDARTAWAPRYANAGMQSITLGFDTPVYSSGAMIRQTFGNGFVRIVELRDSATGEFHAMPFGTDNSSSGLPVDFEMSWSLTTFQADAIRITIDTDHSASYEEIDAVSLRGI